MKDKYYIGFDLGGTKMYAALFSPSAKILTTLKKRTKAWETTKENLFRISKMIHTLIQESQISKEQIAGIGIGVPGSVHPYSGIVFEAPNLGWKNVGLKLHLQKEFACPVFVGNDADLGVYGEYVYGAAQNAFSVLGIFIGTGIGGAFVYQGNILTGKNKSCMEIGHFPSSSNILCGCGLMGCLEASASRTFIASQIASSVFRGQTKGIKQADLSEIKSRVISNAYSENKAVQKIVNSACLTIGKTIAGIIHLLSPEVVVLGGGLTEAMPEVILNEVSFNVEAHLLSSFKKSYKIRATKLGDDAVVFGGFASIKNKIQREQQ